MPEIDTGLMLPKSKLRPVFFFCVGKCKPFPKMVGPIQEDLAFDIGTWAPETPAPWPNSRYMPVCWIVRQTVWIGIGCSAI